MTIKEYIKQWRLKNIEKDRAYRRKNKKKNIINIHSYNKRNKDKLKARKYCQKHFSLLNKKCELCGSIRSLERHHLNYNEPTKIIILCKKCHLMVHKIRKDI